VDTCLIPISRHRLQPDKTVLNGLLLGRIALLRTYMRPIVTDRVAWSVGQSVCLYRSVIRVSPAKTAEPVETPFGLWAWMGPRNHVLYGSADVLRDIAMATNFGTKIAISWLGVNDSD